MNLYRIFILIISWSACCVYTQARPVDLSTPDNEFGSANLFGYLRIWREIGEMDFGNGLSLPVRVEFSSEYENPSAYLGKGWSCPILESKVWLINERLMKAQLPCGRNMYLRRSQKDVFRFYSMNREWSAILEGEKITIRRGDGWELRYVNGRLAQLKTDTDRMLTWKKQGEVVVEIQEEGNVLHSFKVERNRAGEPIRLLLNEAPYIFQKGKRPRVEVINGNHVIGGFDETLTGWIWPDGNKETYEFAVNEKVEPTLKVTDRFREESHYRWNAKNKHVIADDEWEYRVGEITDASTVPKLFRKNAIGEEEFLFIMTKTGKTERKDIQRGHTITEVFKTPGPLYDKVRQVQRVKEDGGLETLYKASYDDMGRLVRKIDESGLMTAFNFNEEGKLTSKNIEFTPSIAHQEQLKLDEQQAVTRVSDAETQEEKDAALRELGLFYAKKMYDTEKAMAILPQIKDPRQAFTLGLHTILSDNAMTDLEKAEAFEKMQQVFPEQEEFLDYHINKFRGTLPKRNGGITIIRSN